MLRYFRLAGLALLLSVGVGSVGSASCYNNEEGLLPLRLFEVCTAGKCVEDTLLWECGNMSWSGAGFSSGFSADCSVETSGEGYDAESIPAGCNYSLNGVELVQPQLDLLKCSPIHPSDGGCMWYPGEAGSRSHKFDSFKQ